MRVNVKGHGSIKFPDDMPEKDIREFLKQFEVKKDDTSEKLLESIEKMVNIQKPQIVKETAIQVVNVPQIVEQPSIQTLTVERMVPRETPPWRFTVDKDDGTSYTITAEPING